LFLAFTLNEVAGLRIDMWSIILRSTGMPAARVSRETTSPTAVTLLGRFLPIRIFSSGMVLLGSPGMSFPNGSFSLGRSDGLGRNWIRLFHRPRDLSHSPPKVPDRRER